MISDADIARAIGCGPDAKPEWWCEVALCPVCGCGIHPKSDFCSYCALTIVPENPTQEYNGPPFDEWGPQTGLMWDWLVQKWGVINIHAANANSDAVRIGYPFDGLFGDTLPLALCEAVEKARTE